MMATNPVMPGVVDRIDWNTCYLQQGFGNRQVAS